MKEIVRLFENFVESSKFDSTKIDPLSIIYKYAESKSITIKESVLIQLKIKPMKTINNVLSAHSMGVDDLYEKEILTDFEFWIFGCPLSTDIDIAIKAITETQVIRHQQNKIKINMEYLNCELKKLDYDLSKELDISLIYIEDGKLKLCSKGSKETQNIIYNTHKFHRQKFPNPFTDNITIHCVDKIIAIVKKWIDSMEDIFGKDIYFEKYRDDKIKNYHIFMKKASLCINSMKDFAFTHDTSIKTLNVIKSIVMKIIQLVLCKSELYVYDKKELALSFNDLYDGSYEACFYMLTRGKYGKKEEINEWFRVLVKLFEIELNHYIDMEDLWNKIEITPDENPTKLSDELVSEFWKSPLKPTEKFTTMFMSSYPDGIFDFDVIIPCFGIEHVPDKAKDMFIWISQRTPVWYILLMKYTSHYSRTIIDTTKESWIDDVYNLIRGCIIELYVIKNIDFYTLTGIDYKKISTGYVVKNDEGFAPDLILVNPAEPETLIPVEIKCLPMKHEINKAYHRTYKLSTMQLEGACKILESKKGMLIWIYIYYETGKIKYELFYAYHEIE
jgi:hypothetical protein